MTLGLQSSGVTDMHRHAWAYVGLGFAHVRQDLYQVGCRLHPQLCLFFFLMILAGGTPPEEITRYVQLFSITLLLREP